MEPTKLYILTSGEYAEYAVEGFVLTEEEALKAIEQEKKQQNLYNKFKIKLNEALEEAKVSPPHYCWGKRPSGFCTFTEPKPTCGDSQKEYIEELHPWRKRHQEHHDKLEREYKLQVMDIRNKVASDMGLEKPPRSGYELRYEEVERWEIV